MTFRSIQITPAFIFPLAVVASLLYRYVVYFVALPDMRHPSTGAQFFNKLSALLCWMPVLSGHSVSDFFTKVF